MAAFTAGAWGTLFSWPLVGIHSILTQDGKILSFGTDLAGNQGSVMYHDVWDPVTNTHTTINHHATAPTDIFCANAIIIPGTSLILIAGGDGRPLGDPNHGVPDVNVYDAVTKQIIPDSHGPMAFARWYANAISLPDGQILVTGGDDADGKRVTTPEVYTPGEGWRSLTSAIDYAQLQYYNRTFLRDDGKVLYFDESRDIKLLDIDGTGTLTKIGTLPFYWNWESNATQYAPGKILVSDTGSGLWTMDINGDVPVFARVGDLGSERNFASMTVLADGRVMINGGSSVTHYDSTAIRTAVIWNPADNSLTDAGTEAVPRLYHSTAILLADGTILSMGGGAGALAPSPVFATQQNGQIYKPSYLFDANNNLAVRPKVLEAPEHVQAGTSFTITVDDAASIQKVTFVRAGSVTHDYNMTSGFMNLSFVAGPDNTITVTLPDAYHGAEPGSWMLFAWNAAGVPSVAPMIAIDPVFDTGAALDPSNLLTNGSFETAASLGTTFKVLNSVAGWQSTQSNFELWKNGYKGIAAQDGASFIEVDAGRGTLFQTFKSKAGQTYELSFDYAGQASLLATCQMEVLWNGTVVATISPTDAAFRTYTFSVTGTGGRDQLAFRALASDTDAIGGLLDHVALRIGSVVAPANLIINGNFETPSLPASAITQSFSNAQMTGWQNGFGGAVNLVKSNGSQMLKTDGNGTLEAFGQSIQTKAGVTYTLSLDAMATVAGTSVFEIYWNGIRVATVDAATTGLERFYFNVVGTGGADMLSFRELSGQNDHLGSYIDNVTLVEGITPVPGLQLIVNGNMQAPSITNALGWQAFTNIQMQGWQNASIDNVVLVNHLGSQMLDLDPEDAADELFQNVKTLAGQDYVLSFDAIGTEAGSSVFDVLWNGVVVATIDPSLTALQRFTLTVSGTGGLDKLSFRELASQNDSLGAYVDNVSLVKAGFEFADPGHHEGNHVDGTPGADVLNGTVQPDHIKAGDGNDTINAAAGDDVIDAGIGNDVIDGSFGKDWIDGGLGTDTLSFRSATSGVTADLFAGKGTRGDALGDVYVNIEKVIGSDFDDILVAGNTGQTLVGYNGNDNVVGGAGADFLYGGNDNDVIYGRKGVDYVSGGMGTDYFFFALGDSGQTGTTFDRVADLSKGVAAYHDKIDFQVALTIGGSNKSATSTQAFINQTTGIAHFAVGSGRTFADAVNDIATRFTAAANSVGEMALFRISNTGSFYMFVSDGVAGVTANDVIIRLDNITSVGSITLAGGDFGILT